MLKAYRFKIYPTKSQKTRMERTLNLCRWVYNQTLALRKNAWVNESKSISKHETHNLLPTWKKDKPELKEVFSQVLQNVQARVDLALKAFFGMVKAGEIPGYPRFRGKGRYDSFTYPQSGFSLKPGKLYLSKIGDIKIKVHRAIEGTVKTCTIRRMPTGKWFACFSVETDVPLPPKKEGPVVGIDVGLQRFATLSNGEYIDNHRFFRSEEKELARVQRKLSKAPKGSFERKSALKVVESVHERTANCRSDFVNKVSRDLVDRFGLIAFEDLDIRNMHQNHNLAKSISDVAWGMLVNATQSKAAYSGSEVVLVDPRNTSQVCSGCGLLVKKELADRVHSCPGCGLDMDRDLNAALNILRLVLQSLGVGSRRSPGL